MNARPKVVTVTIANGATTSGSIDTDIYNEMGIVWPAAFTGTKVNLEVSNDNSTWYLAKDQDDSEISITLSAGNMTVLKETDARISVTVARYVRLKSDASEGAERTFIIFLGSW